MKQEREHETGGVWRMTLAMALSGTIGALVLVSGQSAQTVVLFRCLIGAIALLGYLAWQGQWKRLDMHALRWLLISGAALIANWLCLFSAYRLSSISIATVVYHVQPFFLILLGAIGQRELPRRNKLPWLVLAFIGVALAAGLDGHGTGASMANGVMLALAAAFLYAVVTLATRRLSEYAPAQIAGLQLLLGALVLAPLTRFSVDAIAWQGWASLGVLGVVHTGLMYNLMYGAYQRLRTDTIATLSFIYPLVAFIVDRFVFHTVLSPMQLLGICLILAAVLANQRTTAHRSAPTIAIRQSGAESINSRISNLPD